MGAHSKHRVNMPGTRKMILRIATAICDVPCPSLALSGALCDCSWAQDWANTNSSCLRMTAGFAGVGCTVVTYWAYIGTSRVRRLVALGCRTCHSHRKIHHLCASPRHANCPLTMRPTPMTA